jgi:hypothetical protein
MSEDVTPAGWYDDGTGRQRWFDGTQWGAYADTQASAPATAPAATPADDGPVVVRRTRRSPFIAPAGDQADQSSSTIVSRDWGLGLRSSNAKKDSGMTRNRKIAGDLPGWSPLPPGELVVDRHPGSRP